MSSTMVSACCEGVAVVGSVSGSSLIRLFSNHRWTCAPCRKIEKPAFRTLRFQLSVCLELCKAISNTWYAVGPTACSCPSKSLVYNWWVVNLSSMYMIGFGRSWMSLFRKHHPHEKRNNGWGTFFDFFWIFRWRFEARRGSADERFHPLLLFSTRSATSCDRLAGALW